MVVGGDTQSVSTMFLVLLDWRSCRVTAGPRCSWPSVGFSCPSGMWNETSGYLTRLSSHGILYSCPPPLRSTFESHFNRPKSHRFPPGWAVWWPASSGLCDGSPFFFAATRSLPPPASVSWTLSFGSETTLLPKVERRKKKNQYQQTRMRKSLRKRAQAYTDWTCWKYKIVKILSRWIFVMINFNDIKYRKEKTTAAAVILKRNSKLQL